MRRICTCLRQSFTLTRPLPPGRGEKNNCYVGLHTILANAACFCELQAKQSHTSKKALNNCADENPARLFWKYAGYLILVVDLNRNLIDLT